MTRVEASAPGKIILFGEHFVVKGVPSLAASINLRARVKVTTSNDECVEILSLQVGRIRYCGEEEFIGTSILKPFVEITRGAGLNGSINIIIDSDVPIGAGLGSSAAASVAIAGAVSHLVEKKKDDDEVFRLAMIAERIFHERPSGIDPLVALKGGLILFRSRESYERIPVERIDDTVFLLVDTGVPRKTSQAVRKVLERYERFPETMKKIYESAEQLVMDALKALKNRDYVRLGELMLINHGLLNTLGISFESAEKIVATAVRAGALGAKITGAGLGGYVLVMAEEEKTPKIIEKLKNIGTRNILRVRFEREGLIVREI